jgi:hypothetical protein
MSVFRAEGDPLLLDLFSTSATSASTCVYNAPYLYVPGNGGKAKLFQTCCNHWDCPRCGEKRAKYEYGRIVEGARKLTQQGIKLYMMTITCRGDEDVATSEREYLKRTKKFNDTIRLRYKRKVGKLPLVYAVCVERQSRGNPHSHYITNYVPDDALNILSDYPAYTAAHHAFMQRIPPALRFFKRPLDKSGKGDLFSPDLMQTSYAAGLGIQSDVTEIEDIEGASRYIAKYLFKDMVFEAWPKGWKRVRYTQNWPKLPVPESKEAFVVMSRDQWATIARLNERVECYGVDVLKRALRHQVFRAFCVQPDGEILSASNVDERV